MILIEKNTINDKVVFTLDEQSTLSMYYPLFAFTNLMSGEIKYFLAEDISTARSRYNEFIIEETTAALENVYNGKINLALGTYDYTVYEMDPDLPMSIDPADALGVLETGLATCWSSLVPQYTIYTGPNNNEPLNIVYDN